MKSHDEILELERAFNVSYIESFNRGGGETYRSGDIPRSSEWVDPAWGSFTYRREPGPIAGRVAFERPDFSYGSSVYFGPHGIAINGSQVVNYIAPAGILFYAQELGTHLDFPRVVGRRTFVSDGLEIVDYFDEGDTSLLNYPSEEA